MQLVLNVTHNWLNEAGDVSVSRYMLKFDRLHQHWELQVMLRMTDSWVGVDLPIIPRSLQAVHQLHIYSNVIDNNVVVEFSDNQQYQYVITVTRHLLTIERFNRGDLTHQVWHIANLINASIDIG
jgi:hypothetical protein